MPLARLVVGLLLCLPLLAHAQCPGLTTQVMPFAKEVLLVGATAQPLTASIYKPSGVTPSLATVSVEGGPIRYDVVGTPTDTSGHPVLAPATFTICGFETITRFRVINLGVDAFLTITYYKVK